MMKRAAVAFLFGGLLAFAAAGQSTIFIVRHAEKANDAKDPDLSPTGHARAEALAQVLKDAHISAIYATEFKRTQQTAAPLARALGLETLPISTDVASSTTDLADKLKAARGNALVVGHTNTIPNLIKALGIPESVTIAESDYDNLLVITLGGSPRLVRLHYLTVVGDNLRRPVMGDQGEDGNRNSERGTVSPLVCHVHQ